jgi:hypothetical protein
LKFITSKKKKGGVNVTAQNFLKDTEEETTTPAACGTACGAGDDGEKKEEPTSPACGTACGAGE